MKLRKLIISLLALALILCSCSKDNVENTEESSDSISQTQIIEIISPYAKLHGNAKNPWDMIIHNGYLYVGGGDYDVNASPKYAYRYNLSTEEWEQCGEIPDEQIRNFLVFDNELYIPGTDPTADWGYGNFYKLENSEFVTYRTIPGGVHCFDLEKVDNKLFAAIGVKDGSFPVVVSTDNGNTFEKIDVVKNDHNYISDERVYTLFNLNGTLYAVLGSNVYRYDDGKFKFECSWSNKFVQTYKYYTPIGARVVFNGRVFFTSGCLFSFDDPRNLIYIPFENSVVTDVLVYNDKLYTLSFSQNENGKYTNTIKCSDNGTNFETVFEFEYDYSALSIVINDNDGFIGIGGTTGPSEYKGYILKVEGII